MFEKFLNEEVSSRSVAVAYENIFEGIKYIEERDNKNVLNFDEKEVNELIDKYVRSKTYNATMVKLRLLRKFFHYIGNYTIDKLSDNIDNLVSSSHQVQHNRYISKEDLISLIGRLDNTSDKCIIMLLRNGIGIEFEIEDLINLTIEDVDFKNKTINNKPIDSYTMMLVEETMKEHEYISIGTYEKIIVYNMNSKYLFKTRITKGTNEGLSPFKPSGFRGRLQRIKMFLNDDERVVLSNLILSYVVDLVVDHELKCNVTMTQGELRMFLNKTIGNSKNVYDIRTMANYVKNNLN